MSRRLSLQEFRARLEGAGIRPSKSRGQNFLYDPALAEAIARDAGITGKDRVVEIGTGCGYLTASLARRAGKIFTIEIQKNLQDLARETLEGQDNITFWEGSILGKGNRIPAALEEKLIRLAPFTVVANLPYSISGPVLANLCSFRPGIPRIVVLVQKEMAERLAAKPGEKNRGPLTLAAELYYQAKILRKVGAEVFWPQPRVDSLLIGLERVRKSINYEKELIYKKLVSRAFQQKRKTLRSSLRGVLGPGVEEILENSGLDPSQRPEMLPAGDFLTLAGAISL